MLLLAQNVVDLVDILRSVTDIAHTDEWHLQLFKALEEYQAIVGGKAEG